jgi:hypothetical protein
MRASGLLLSWHESKPKVRLSKQAGLLLMLVLSLGLWGLIWQAIAAVVLATITGR